MPYGMLGKCATAAVVRRAWPATDGLYIREEFQNPPEFTDSGRQIVYPEAEPSHPVPLIENAAHGYEPGSEKAKQAEAALKRVEDADRELKEKQQEKPASIPEDKSNGIIELDLTIANDVIIRGDIGNLLELIQKHCTAKWSGDWWHILPTDVSTIHAMGQQLGFRIVEILPKQVPSEGKSGAAQTKAQSAQGKAASQTQRKETKTNTSAAAGATLDAGPLLVSGIIEQANPQSGKSPRLDVLLRMETSKVGVWMSAWDTAHFPFITKGKGQQAEFIVKKTVKGDKTFTNITGLRRIGVREFDEDGKTPVLRTDREPGAAGNLFQP
jgi:hypothetical protein